MDYLPQMVRLTKDISHFVLFKMKACQKIPEVDVSLNSLELVENLRKVVWVERYILASEASKFLTEHKDRMRSRVDLYIVYALYLCHLTEKCFTDPYEVFIRAVTLLYMLCPNFFPDRFEDLVGVSATAFTCFYVVIRLDFEKRGGLENLNSYLLQRDTLRQFSNLEVLEKEGKTGSEIIKLLNLQPTLLEEYLSKDIKGRDIESHIPSRTVTYAVINCGCADLQKMVNYGDIPLNAYWDPDKRTYSESYGNSIKQTSSESTKAAYLKARKSVREFHAICKKLEQLLDLIFEETS